MRRNLFWLGDEQWRRIEPHLPKDVRCKPTIRHYPDIFEFLGNDPFPIPQTLPARIASARRRLGLPLKELAAILGVDEGTMRRWEREERSPRRLACKVEILMALAAER
jgi:DNA-binding XRE family transcriptional regulator